MADPTPNATAAEPPDATHDPHACAIAVPLTDASPGEVVLIDRLELAHHDTARLLRLGLTPGRTITLLRAGARPLIATAGARLALDRALVQHVYVVRSNATPPAADAPVTEATP